jgi:hypothetical protein
LSYFGIHYQDDCCFCCPDFSLSWSHRQAFQSVVALFGSLGCASDKRGLILFR